MVAIVFGILVACGASNPTNAARPTGRGDAPLAVHEDAGTDAAREPDEIDAALVDTAPADAALTDAAPTDAAPLALDGGSAPLESHGDIYGRGQTTYIVTRGTIDRSRWDEGTPLRPCGPLAGQCRTFGSRPSSIGSATILGYDGTACQTTILEEIDALERLDGPTRLLPARTATLYRFEGCPQGAHGFFGEATVTPPPARRTLGRLTGAHARVIREHEPGCAFRGVEIEGIGTYAVFDESCAVAPEVVLRPSDEYAQAFHRVITFVHHDERWYIFGESSFHGTVLLSVEPPTEG